MNEHRHIIVHGTVQGVWFRKYTQEEARKLGLSGWVANRDDGTVEIEVEGPLDKLNSFLAWCEQGSPLSRVEKLTIHSRSVCGYHGFHIRRH